ncbi:MAG: AAA family ATPase [Planctomycetes bacterium]|nr:AAA family ATPase [Planctomycetota bacterium]
MTGNIPLQQAVDAAFGVPRTAPAPSQGTAESLVSRLLPGEKRETRPALTFTPLAELLAEAPEPFSWLVEGLIPRGGLAVLAGKPKAGKSTLARCLALAVARGAPVLGRPTTPGAVVYVGLEDRRADVAEHFRAMGATNEPLFINTGPVPTEVPNVIGQLADMIAERGAVLAILDTLFRTVHVRDANDYASVTRVLDPVLNLARTTHCAILAVHHAGKVDRDGLEALLGSTALGGTCDVGLLLRRYPDGTRSLRSVQRTGADLPETLLELDPLTRTIGVGPPAVERERCGVEAAILEALAEGPRNEGDLRELVGGNTGVVGRVLRELVRAGRVRRSGKGKANDPYQYHAGAAQVAPDEVVEEREVHEL